MIKTIDGVKGQGYSCPCRGNIKLKGLKKITYLGCRFVFSSAMSKNILKLTPARLNALVKHLIHSNVNLIDLFFGGRKLKATS